ncbi:Cytochrome B561 [Magnetospirillum sp. LM-5]|uniref:cytochrome b/b6 domain-containing protein n=1 Tax=Magnetospirillum sp. LM-5 TaxID=2681466 RepID=UPI001380D996|nr:cytochrome b/b6 domain-containing protein [Magnetospirillum sp. LM-5]CAA7619218.1 Cytochrome B561 [Magnetospirillum sp. LM-5]
MAKAVVFTRFERLWHWTQAILIVALMLTGFTVHGTLSLMKWGRAADLHVTLAWALLVLWAFAIFWHVTTGQWRHYIPTGDKLVDVARYYTIGIFQPGVKHPYKKSLTAKHNPLQRLAYLFFKLIISPALWVSGLLYMFYNDWPAWGLGGLSLGLVAFVHTGAAFLMLVFFIAHVYMAFTGKPWWEMVGSMITGKAEVVDPPTG